MIVRRQWRSDLYAFYCAEEMDRLGITIIAIIPPVPRAIGDSFWEVWGQTDKPIDFDKLDRLTDERIEGDKGQ